MKIAFLSGGTGTPKLLQGFRSFIDDSQITVICNNGDDFEWNGLYICPDLDTVLYLFSNKLDLDKFWGIKNDTFSALSTLKSLDAPASWFNIGDQDMGLHVYRTFQMLNKSLTEVTEEICTKWGIAASILPMSDKPVQSRITTPVGELAFQEFFVKHRTTPEVVSVRYTGDKKQSTDRVISALEDADIIIIGPSNPITSIGPILAVEEIVEKLSEHKSKVIVISPLIGENAFSGPTIKLMRANNIEPDILGLGKFYNTIGSVIVIDPKDEKFLISLQEMGYRVIISSIEMKTIEQKQNLARTILSFM